MNRKKKPLPVGITGALPLGKLLRQLRIEDNWSLIDMSYYANCSSSNLSNVEAGRGKLSETLLYAYEKCLEMKPCQIGAFFLLLHTGIISPDTLFKNVTQVDLEKAVKIVEPLYSYPELLEPIAVFIKNAGCGLSGYFGSYHSQIIKELEQHHRPSLIEFRLRTFLKDLSEGDK
jgi:transcriptional regulator with XRE-family HTH domain